MTQSVFATFAPHFAPSPAPVAQWIEQRFPKPQVACSIHAGGTNEIRVFMLRGCAKVNIPSTSWTFMAVRRCRTMVI